MADNKDIGLKINVDTGGASKTIGELRKEFTDLQTVINSTKQGSEEFNKAIVQLAEVKGSIKDVKQQMMALDPDERARAFSALGQTIVGGFVAAKGAAALFGASQENIEKSILKIQGATALLQGFQSVADAQKQLNIVKIIALQKLDLLNTNLQGAAESKNIIIRNLATAAQWALNVAMNANPIGLLIAAVAALGGAMYLLTRNTKAQIQSTKDLNDELKTSSESYKEIVDNIKKRSELSKGGVKDIENEIRVLKAKGATDEELQAKEIKLIQEKIDAKQHERNVINNQLESNLQKQIDYSESVKKLSDEQRIEKQNEIIEAENNLQKEIDLIKDRRGIIISEAKTLQTDLDLISINADKKKRDEQDTNEKKEKEKREKQKEELKKQKEVDHKTFEDLEEKFYLESITNKDRRETETLRKELEKERIKIEALKISTEEKQKLSDDLENVYQIKIEEKISEQKAAKNEREIKEQNDEIAQQDEFDKQRSEQQKTQYDQELRDKQEVENAKLSIQKSSFEGLTALGSIFISNSKKLESFNKGLALTQIAIDTAQAISSLTKNAEGQPLNLATGGLAGIAYFASGLARILVNIAKAKQLLSGSGSTAAPSLSAGGGGAGAALQSQAGQISQPTANVFVNPATTTFGGANRGERQGRPEQQSIRVFVTETDITRTQEKIDRINKRATIE